MSAGRFTLRFYVADSGEIHLLRNQPESAALDVDGTPNTVAAGPATSPFWAKSSRGANQYGLRPRKVGIRWNPGQAPAGYKEEEVLFVDIYQANQYNAMTINSPATYQGGTGTLVSKQPESIYPGI